ncbi:uncharacterized protein LOC122722242 [Manihot esculenta]|uniref:uncharacterized protein LOC122722242 n=1 Tax=Manihot esculenta TaxID=3983 RepID=UPI001CC5131C|nr:uncharacterized protein LOC122722242 [Manihot esculenta]
MKEISNASQANNNIMMYYTKLKKLWDEYACLEPIPVCECGVAKLFAEIEGKHKLMQFLMGLNESYDHVRNQILIMEPLPSVNKAYSMILRIEKQRETQNDEAGNSAMTANTSGINKGKTWKNQFKKKDDKTCSYCKTISHVRETCFKLNGYPDWFNELKLKKNKGKENVAAHVFETPLDYNDDHTQGKVDWNMESLMQEMIKYMKNHGQNTVDSNDANFVNYTGFAGMTSSCYSKVYENRTIGEWIIDTGATVHMCNDLSLFSNHRTLNRPSVVTLPDGSMKNITKIGTVPLNQNMQLLDVLYMPTFKYNLLSVSQITQTNKISVQFYHNQYILQDLVTKHLLAVGRMHQGLYRLNKGSFSHQGSRIKTIGTALTSQQLQGNYEVWHRRLGHASKNKLLHLNVIKANDCDFHVCTICPIAKQQRLSFNKSKITSTTQFELIHVDLWGPYSVVSVSNARYVLT